VGAKLGILIKGGGALETAHKITSFIFDKTGTLTLGKPLVTRLTILNDSMPLSHICYLIGSAELNSEHILGQAIISYAKVNSEQSLTEPDEFVAVSGRGLKCRVAGEYVAIGNRAWMKENKIFVSSFAEVINRLHLTPFVTAEN
jgi:Cu+-exporting ATPase